MAPVAAIAGTQQKKAAALTARLSAQFGELSDRERAIYDFVWRRAYQRGYNVAYQTRFPKTG